MTCVYRAFDAEDRLLYVGIADDVERRIAAHQGGSGWFDHAERLVIESHVDRAAAMSAERQIITRERPLWNLQGSPDKAAAQKLVDEFAASQTITIPTAEELEALLELFDSRERRLRRLLRRATFAAPTTRQPEVEITGVCGAVA